MFYTQYTDTRYQSLKLEVRSIFSFAWYLAKKNIISFLVISAISHLLFMELIGGFIANYLIYSGILPVYAGSFFSTLFSIPFTFFGFCIMIYIIRNFLSGKLYSFAFFRFALARWVPVFGAYLVSTLAMLGGFLIFIIPGFIFSTWFAFATSSAAFEELNLKEALKYSKSLVYGRFWKVFGILFLSGFLIGFIGSFIGSFVGFKGFIHSFTQIIMGVLGPTLVISIFLAFQKFPVQPSASTIENSASSAT